MVDPRPVEPMRQPLPAPRGKPLSRWSAALIVVFWLGMMVLLALQQSGRRGATAMEGLSPQLLAKAWQDSTDYALLTVDSTVVGAVVTSMTREQSMAPTYLIEVAATAKLGLLPNQQICANLAARLDEQFHLQQVAVVGELPIAHFVILGKVDFPDFYLETRVADVVRRARFRLEKPIALADAFRSALFRAMTPRPGTQFSFEAVDPLWNMKLGRVDLEIGDLEKIRLRGEETTAYRVTTRYGDLVTHGWIDPLGRIVKQQLFGTLSLERAPESEVTPRLTVKKIDLNRLTPDVAAFKSLSPQPFSPQSLLGLGVAMPPLAESVSTAPTPAPQVDGSN